MVNSSFQLEAVFSIADCSQSISPIAFLSAMVARLCASATWAFALAFVFSTLPSSHVPASWEIGPQWTAPHWGRFLSPLSTYEYEIEKAAD